MIYLLTQTHMGLVLQMWRDHPVCGAGYLCLQGGLALGATAGSSSRHAGPQ